MLQVSSDLVTWSTVPAGFVTVMDSPTRLVLRDKTPIQDALTRFVRLDVSPP